MQNKIYEIIDSVHALTGLGIVYYDSNDFFKHNFGALDGKLRGYYCDFCKAVRELPGGFSACDANSVVKAAGLAKLYREPFFDTCHLGLYEYIVPVFHNEELEAIFVIGQCVIKGETVFNKTYENIAPLHGEYKYFEELFNSLPIKSREDLTAAGRLVYMSINENSADLDELLPVSDIAQAAKQYIDSNYVNDISQSQIASRLNLDAASLSRQFKAKYKTGIPKYVLDTRMKRAKALLAQTNIPISHIALNVGYKDANSFSRAFKNLYNTSPLEYRMESFRSV